MLEAIIGTIGLAVLGIVAWAFQLNSSVAVNETNISNLSKNLEDRLEDIKKRLERIERHVLNGHAKR